MGSIKDILEFDKQLHSITEAKPPVSASKIAALVKMAMKQTKLAKHIVNSVEKFIQKCPVDYKLSGLYVVDGISRAAQKGTEPEANHFLIRFEERLTSIVPSLTSVNEKDKDRTKRLLALWKKGAVFDASILDTCEALVDGGEKPFAPMKMSDRDPRRRLRKDSPSVGTTQVDTCSVLSALNALTNTSTATAVTAPPGLNVAAALLPLLQGQKQPPTAIPAAEVPNPLLSALTGQTDQSSASNPLAALLANIPGIANIPGLNNSNQPAKMKGASDFEYEEEDGQRFPKYESAVTLPDTNPSLDSSRRPSVASSGGLVGNLIDESKNRWGSADTDKSQADRRPSQDRHGSVSSANAIPITPRDRSQGQEERSKPSSKDEGPPYCIEPKIDPSVPEGHIKVLGRTVYVGGVNALVTTENLRSAFESVGRVQTVTLNYDKFNAFIKMYTHEEAKEVRDKLNRTTIESAMIKVAWGCGFGPKNVFDYNTGISMIPISQLSHSDQSVVRHSQRGGGALESQMVMEEPDLPISLKGDTTTGTPGFKDGVPPAGRAGRGRGRGRGGNHVPVDGSGSKMPGMPMMPMGMPPGMMFHMPPFPLPGLSSKDSPTADMPMFPMGMPALPQGMDPASFGFPFGFPGVLPTGEVSDKRHMDDDEDHSSKKKARH